MCNTADKLKNLLFWKQYFRIDATMHISMYNVEYAATQLGIHCREQFPNSEESPLKLGIKMIQKELGYAITKTQIKTFIKCKAKGEQFRIPYNSVIIFKALAKLVDERPEVKKACQAQCMHCVNAQSCDLCRERMMHDFCTFIDNNYDHLPPRAKTEVYDELMSKNNRCV